MWQNTAAEFDDAVRRSLRTQNTPARSELEDRWRKRVQLVKLRLDLYRLQVKQIKELSEQIPPPDGGFAYRQTLRAETAALADYCLTLRMFSDLVVEGKVPDENAWKRSVRLAQK
jgi:hypothetical protein